MAVSRQHYLARTSDGKYLDSKGAWVSGTTNAVSLASRSTVGATVQSKPSGTYRMTKEYTVG